MKAAVFLLICVLAYACAQNVGQVVSFANSNWNCADPSCSQRVPQGSWQDNYECAEFVARSIASGGYIPNLGPLDSQSAYGSYSYSGKTYNLLWVSSKQGGSAGLEDFLIAAGWGSTSTSNIQAAYVVIVVGSDGPYSHVGIGVGNGVIDAHNAAEYQVSSIGTVNAIHTPPGSVPSSNGNAGSTSGAGNSGPSSSDTSGPASSGNSGPSSSGNSGPSSSGNSGPSSGNSGPSSGNSGHSGNSGTSGNSGSTGTTYGMYFDSKPVLGGGYKNTHIEMPLHKMNSVILKETPAQLSKPSTKAKATKPLARKSRNEEYASKFEF